MFEKHHILMICPADCLADCVSQMDQPQLLGWYYFCCCSYSGCNSCVWLRVNITWPWPWLISRPAKVSIKMMIIITDWCLHMIINFWLQFYIVSDSIKSIRSKLWLNTEQSTQTCSNLCHYHYICRQCSEFRLMADCWLWNKVRLIYSSLIKNKNLSLEWWQLLPIDSMYENNFLAAN